MKTQLLHYLMSGCNIEMFFHCRVFFVKVTCGDKMVEDQISYAEADLDFETRLSNLCEVALKLKQSN